MSGRPVKIVGRASLYAGRCGVVVADAGVAEHGPDTGRAFVWVALEGIKYPDMPLMFREDELEDAT